MIITCEACNTRFNLEDQLLNPTGSKVRCSICSNVFTAFPAKAPVPDSPVAAATPQPPAPEAPVASPAPETAVLQEEPSSLLSEGPDLDFALEEEPEEEDASADVDIPTADIEDAVSNALEENLGLSLDEAPVAAAEGVSGDDTIIASIDDDDFQMALADENGDENGDESADTMISSLDDGSLDLTSLDSDLEDSVIADLDQGDLDLNDGDGATVIADLDDDFSLEPEPETQPAAPDSGPRTLDDLDGLNLSLDIEPEAESSPAPAPPAPSPEAPDEISLDDFSLEMEEEPAAEAAAPPPAPPKEEPPAEDLVLSLDMDADEAESVSHPPAAESPLLEDDLDLSSLESLLDDDADSEEDIATMVVDDTEELELSLDIDHAAPLAEPEPKPEEPAPAADDGLELDLSDGDLPEDSLDLNDIDGADEEVDLSEIEKMLEEPEEGGTSFSSSPDQDLDLDIEASLETEKWMGDADGGLVADEELDLSELEQALEDVDLDAPDEEPEDAELELDITDEEPVSTSAETLAVGNDLDFDLSDFEDDTPQPAADKGEEKPADMELEFEIDDDHKDGPTMEDDGLEDTVAIPIGSDEGPDTIKQTPAAPVAPAPQQKKTKPAKGKKGRSRKKAKPPKKGVSKSLVFLLILVILGGGGYGTYYLLNQNNIEIPFLSEYLKPKVNDPGNLKLTTYDVNARFVENANAGKLFVITGKVKNGYGDNRGVITLTGQIYSTGKVLAKKERVYCGNIMSDLELANLEMDKIKSRLANRLGDNRSNVKIEPGKSIPFMVVFAKLPEDLEEYTIEVTGSTALK